MGKRIKKYGVYGLMDWQPLLSVGKAKFQPLFSGGGVTAYGETPAKYVTSNPVCQHIIESSKYYKSGYIKLLYDSGCNEQTLEDLSEVKMPDSDQASMELETKEFAANSDAVAFLNETYDIPKAQMRSRDQIVEKGKSCGIDIKFID